MHSRIVSNCSTSLLDRISVTTRFLFGRALADAESYDFGGARRVFQHVAGLMQQVGDVDGGQWIGAFDDQDVVRRQTGEGLARTQGGQGTFQPAQIESLFRHSSGSILPRWNGQGRGPRVKSP